MKRIREDASPGPQFKRPFGSSGYESTKEAAEKDDDSEASVSDYEVFLSFRGPDSRQGLADVLYSDMKTAGIRVFRDDDELDIGDEIGKILPAIGSSKICVPIFSSTFAESAWCLREVERMVEFKKEIMPIFYTATPEDVKLGTELFKKELREHEKKHGKEQVKKWEEALKVVARIKGREVKTTGFGEFSTLFVNTLLRKLKVKTKYLADSLVKRDDHEEAVMELLDIDSSDVRIIGIHGMGGIGKTTLAKVIFNQLSARFDCCSFLENIQESLRRNDLEYLQKQLVEDLDPKLKNFQKIDAITILRENICRRRALIVLDDVNQRNQIEMIVGMLGWFGSGSRIIITTRDKSIFTREAYTHAMEEMDPDQALLLFSRRAFRDDSPPSDFRILSEEVLSLTGGLPLAIDIIGSLLFQCEKKRWKATIERLKNVPPRDVLRKLKISFDALEFDQKQIFLDIACFFINKERSNAILMWEACDFYPDDGIEVLVSMSLLKITKDNEFQMHGLVKDLGRELVREECFGDPVKRSRIWSSKEAKEVLKIKQEKENIEGLFPEKLYGDCILKHEQFSGFRNLRLLKLVGAKLTGDFENLLPKLKWFTWQRCPSDFAAINLTLENLVVLDLSNSFITENWAGWNMIEIAKNLKALDLTGCCNLTSTPDLSNNDALEKLILRGCRNLAEIHGSIKKLTRLKHLDLQGCPSLRGLPEEIGSLEDLEEILVDGNHGATFHLPESIGNLHSLSVMKLHRLEITRIPDSIGGLVNLTHLSMRECRGMRTLPDIIGDLKSLVKLDMSGTELSALPDSLGDLESLVVLELSNTELSALPDSVGRLSKLQRLQLYSTKMEELPDSLGDLESLVNLELSNTELSALPDSVGRLSKLQRLQLYSTKIEELPDSLGDLESLVSLQLSSTNLSALPDSVGRLSKLQWLGLSSTKIEELPDSLGDLESLVNLELSNTELSALPDSVGRLSKLQWLGLSSTKIEELPDSLWDLESLVSLQLSSTNLSALPDSVKRLSKLQWLGLDSTKIEELPDSLWDLESLVSLELSYTNLSALPDSVGRLSKLQSLRLSSTKIEELPDSLWDLESLVELELSNTNLSALPDSVGRLSKLQSLRLSSTKIEELPDSLWDLESSVELELSITNLSALPDSVGRLSKLQSLRLSSTKIEELPDSLWDLESLVLLELSYTNLSALPDSVGRLSKLQSLRLSSTKIEELPDSLGDLKSLGTLDLSSSKLRILPDSVGEMSKLRHLLLDECNIRKLPSSIGKLARLEYLELGGLSLQCLPQLPDFSNLKKLQSIDFEDWFVKVAGTGIDKHACGVARRRWSGFPARWEI
ncbi:TMV resistance protein N-like isoform X2 [Punica granatum]|uniref:TMV resistance protein N-like isoform X2 n=1 Tax=Punica granatum TaxID=22663 RepID=A0A6P8CDK5_PUNGR|nr:TMV resistance protein N-like isoform X2 [Punica granatum]XP_031380504.1 TMV resistance protein N-like isoform X2 [Punica granatum]